MAAGLGDVAQGGVALIAGVVDEDVAEAEHALAERSGDGHVLDVA